MRRCDLACYLVSVGVAQTALGQPVSAPSASLRAERVANASLRIDAQEDLAWESAPRVGGFTAREPHEGTPTDPTFVSASYDDEALYLLVEARDGKPEQIQGRLTRRDETSTSDWLHVYLATQSSERFAYRFSINAAGVKQDARILDGTNEDLAYDALWDAAVARHAAGWTAEFRIPFHQLNYGGRPAFRIQVIRYQSRTGEQSSLFPYPKSASHLVRYLGSLQGLEQRPNPVRTEVAPYLSLRWQNDPFTTVPQFAVGGDFKLTLSPEVVLNGTLNPDFGQVEADPSELNLTVYETFLTERRPFFLEGQETLDFGLRSGITTDRLFYTRRIGQPPRVDPGVDSDHVLDYPKSTQILAATKLSARTENGYTVGLLHALTDQAYATVRTSDGQRSVQVAPLTQYAVARGVRDFAHGRTLVGATVTTVTRDLGANLYDTLAKSATTAGVDVEHRTGDIRLTSKAFASHIEGSPNAIRSLQENSVHYFQRPDQHHARLDPTRRSLDGWGLTVVGSKYSGAPLRAAWGGTILSPGFDPNDIGFLQRADDMNAYLYLQYLETRQTRYYRSFYFDANMWSNFTFGGESSARALLLSTNWVWPDTSSTRISVERDAERMDPRVLRGGPAMRIPGRNILTVAASTDDRRPVSLDISGWGGRNDGGVAYWVGGSAQLRIRPCSFIQLVVNPWYQHTLDGWAYIDHPDGGNVIVARMPRDVVNVTLRASVALTTNLTLQLYTMPYLTAGSRSAFAEVMAPRSAGFADHFRPAVSDADRYVWFAQARTNAILRWEYSPGSTAYLVWAREQRAERNDRGTLDFGRDIDSLITAPAVDTIMLKWSHRLAY